MSRLRKPRAQAIDRLVGQRIHDYRILRGMSQSRLAGVAGVTFQQMQKYEQGTNRISASRLYLFAAALDISIAELFEDIPARPSRKLANGGSRINHAALPAFDGVPFTRETMQLMRYASVVPSAERSALIALARKAGEVNRHA